MSPENWQSLLTLALIVGGYVFLYLLFHAIAIFGHTWFALRDLERRNKTASSAHYELRQLEDELFPTREQAINQSTDEEKQNDN